MRNFIQILFKKPNEREKTIEHLWKMYHKEERVIQRYGLLQQIHILKQPDAKTVDTLNPC